MCECVCQAVRAPREAEAGSRSRTVRVIPSAALFGPDREVRIEHQGALYTLRLTSLGKLILTK
jgi:hemin uptake protein HemP